MSKKPSRQDLVTDPATSRRLGLVRQKGTGPELEVRSLMGGLGLRPGGSKARLPGSPDIVNVRRRWCVFVHGCFWHGHSGCPKATVPKRNRAFWEAKFEANRQRDARVVQQLRRLGWQVVVVWACELQERPASVSRRLEKLRSNEPRTPAHDRDHGQQETSPPKSAADVEGRESDRGRAALRR